MRILVDTSIWSLALRRRRKSLSADEQKLCHELGELIREGRAIVLGPVRQELLTGIRDETSFELLKDHLESFPDERLDEEDHVEAARCANRCRARGIAGSPIDFLLCGVARRRSLPIFTTDPDFARYCPFLDLDLHRRR